MIELRYELIEKVGEGSYGSVVKAKSKSSGKTVALKILINQTMTEYDTIKVLREI